MAYPGNEALAEEIRERILNTFRQTLELAEKGSKSEAELGCDFVLRLDPMFEPARELHSRLEASDGAVDVGDFRQAFGFDGPDLLKAELTDPGLGADRPPVEAPAEPAEVLELEPELAAAPEAPAAPQPPQTPEPDVEVVDLDEPAGDTLANALDLSSLNESPAPPSPTPEEPPPPPTHSEPVATLDNESEGRIQDLLDEGQAAFDGAEYQTAIDAWSRIFLIDIDHSEANRRIEMARKLKAEVERQIDETFHDAVSKVEAGQLDEAREGFEGVLEMMPGHMAAKEYLDRLNEPDYTPPAPGGLPEMAPEGAEGELTPDDYGDEDGDAPLLGDMGFDPQAGPTPDVQGVGSATRPAKPENKTFKRVGLAAMLLIAVGGWFLYKNWSVVFPNAAEEVVAPVLMDPISRAKRTYDEAGAAIAIAQLRRLSASHPQYAEAQALLAQWEATLDALNPKTDDTNPEFEAARDQLVAEARSAFGQGQFLLAEDKLQEAGEKAPLTEPADTLLEQIRTELEPLKTEITMFRQGEWEHSLRNLWRLREAGTYTPDVQRLMVDSYFNLGVRNLQRGDPEAAIENFKEARTLAGNDPTLERLIEFASTYDSRPEDLLYRIFVKYLPFR